MGLLQIKKLLHSKGNDQQSEEATNRLKEKSLHTAHQIWNPGFTQICRNPMTENKQPF